MSDTQRQVKMVAEQALANLVERAKRLQLSSVSAFESNANRVANQTLSESTINVAGSLPKKIKGLIGGMPGTQKGAGITARKPRKVDLEPSPPPPSPRELCMIAELRDEFHQTDQLIDQMLNDATTLNRDMINCSQHQRDLSLVQEIELETATRSLDTIFEALNAECEREDLKQVIHRCCHALERAKERSIFEPIPSPHKFIQNVPQDVIYLGPMEQYNAFQDDIANELLPLEPLDVNLYDLNDLNDLDTLDNLDDLTDQNELSSDSNLLSPSKNIGDNKLDQKTPENIGFVSQPTELAIDEQII